MSKFSKILALLAIVASVVLVGFLAGWWGPSRSSTYNQQVAIEPTSSFLATNSIPTPGPAATKAPIRNQRPTHHAGTPAIGSSIAAGTATNLIPDWEDKVDAILTSEGEDSAKAKQMLEMFPRLSAEAQEEVVHHISNLTPDED